MRLQRLFLPCLQFSAVALAFVRASTSVTDKLAIEGLRNLKHYARQNPSGSNCTLRNVAIRREWSGLSKPQRKKYTDAVLCLMSLPARSDVLLVPGARSRYDDFVAVHINQTLSIHGTANFLSWHRYFVWTYEKALREECGYDGYQPYWNWGKYAHDPINSPLFDGSDYSMSGNGIYEAHNCTQALPSGLNCIPAGAGGGCVQHGPFKNMTVNLGPISQTLIIPELQPSTSKFAYNARCLRRDISAWVSSNWTTEADSVELITTTPNIIAFQDLMQGDLAAGDYGVHGGGHFTIGGDPGGDFYASPGDPAFWLHHGNIDRTWWIWQTQDLPNRLDAIGGTITMFDDPPSRNGTLNDVVELGVLNAERKIAALMSTVGFAGSEFCYVYV